MITEHTFRKFSFLRDLNLGGRKDFLSGIFLTCVFSRVRKNRLLCLMDYWRFDWVRLDHLHLLMAISCLKILFQTFVHAILIENRSCKMFEFLVFFYCGWSSLTSMFLSTGWENERCPFWMKEQWGSIFLYWQQSEVVVELLTRFLLYMSSICTV